jgi:hypothetical protein
MRNIEGFWELVLGSNPVLPANQSPQAQSLPVPCEKGPLSAGLPRLNWAGETDREQRVRHLPHHFSVGGFRCQYCPAVPAGWGVIRPETASLMRGAAWAPRSARW